MRMRLLMISLALGGALVFTRGGSPALAARAAPATPTAFGANSEITKVTLSDTSVDAPSLWTSTTGTIRSVVAWTGTDASHHLNVMTSADGVHYWNKRVLDETSFARPGVVSVNGAVAVAWTGMDTNHSLNVLYDVYGPIPRKLTLWQDSSFTAPSLAAFKGGLVLSWAGTDPNQTLNVMPIAVGTQLQAGAKTTLPPSFNSIATPALDLDPVRNELMLTWSARTPATQLSLSASVDGVSWALPVRLPETSVAGPRVVGIPGANAAYMPGHYLAWTGTDGQRSVNVQYTDSYPAWPNPAATKATLAETATGASEIGFIGGPRQVLVAWTGTDTERHLNVAVVTPSSACSPVPGVIPADPTPISSVATTTKQVALTFDTGAEAGTGAAQIVSILASHQLHVTWFTTGDWAQANYGLQRTLRDNGNEIGNHTVDHPDLTLGSPEFVCYELTLGDQLISGVTGTSTRPYFRPPYGAQNSQVRALAGSLGYRTVLWSIDPRDWDPATTRQDILDRVLNSPNLKPGAIILLHGGGPNTPAALDDLIRGLEAKGYAIVTVGQLLHG